ncbi:hypothetical protein K1T71_007649 [Dendrolimus kikuchii]|uniref:Uncharacterized protein n=1 Tax=Dendrolimus kikuchii TaxID=765133 RepID=A0ACC1CY29_9NEOP|nr:hypothetical protein K1T71_007649 [Dendrolimus kikuchii]
MTIAAVSVDFVPSIPRESKPIFEDFFTASSTASLLYYLHIPLLILIILNCVLFVMTVYNIWLVKRAIGNYNSSETRNTQENQYKFKMYLRLFLVMGISWILDIIQQTIEVPSWFHITVDTYHSLSGIFIFYIFIINKSIFRRLEKKLGIKLPGNYQSTKNTNSVMTHKSQSSKRDPTNPQTK